MISYWMNINGGLLFGELLTAHVYKKQYTDRNVCATDYLIPLLRGVALQCRGVFTDRSRSALLNVCATKSKVVTFPKLEFGKRGV